MITDDMFVSTFLEDEDTNGKKPVPIIQSPIIPKEDLEPFSVIEPDYECGPWIAGGACLRWILGQKVGPADIDVFCKDKEQAEEVVKRIKSYKRFQVMATTSNAITFRYYAKDDPDKWWLIQVILVRHFPTLEEVLDSFDISVCQVGTAGFEWKLGEHAVKDIKSKSLRFVNPLRNDSVKRLMKYWTYGFTPVDGTIEAFQNCEEITWSFTHEDYSNAF